MRLYIYGAVVLALIGVAIWIHNSGGESVRTEIEKKDTRAGNTSDGARSRYDLCPPGKWSFEWERCSQ